MIILRLEDGIRIVRQPEHARLSGALARAWRRPQAMDDAIWSRFVEAVSRHDDGWAREEEAPTLDASGQPYDFKSLPTPLHVAVWRRSMELAEAADPYAALLIAQHGRWLSAEFTRGGPEADERVAREFVAEMGRAIEGYRSKLLAGSPAEREAARPEALLAARRLLSFFDGLSLRLLEAIRLERTEPLRFAEREEELSVHGDTPILAVRPWPFDYPALVVEARVLPVRKCRFGSPADLASALISCHEEREHFEVLDYGI